MNAKPVLIKIDLPLFRRIAAMAKEEKRKPGPMIVILLERYMSRESLNGR
jgi:hypothetical protein